MHGTHELTSNGGACGCRQSSDGGSDSTADADRRGVGRCSVGDLQVGGSCSTLRQQVRDGSQNALGTAVELGARAAASDGQDARRVTGSLLESDGSQRR
jgi:hypothetical protein